MAGSLVAWIGWVVLGQLLGDQQVCGAVDEEPDAMLELALDLAVDGCQRFEKSLESSSAEKKADETCY